MVNYIMLRQISIYQFLFGCYAVIVIVIYKKSHILSVIMYYERMLISKCLSILLNALCCQKNYGLGMEQ